MNEAGVARWSEAASAVELRKLRRVVNVDPFHPALTGDRDDPVDQGSADAPPAEVGVDRRLEQERVNASIPRQAYEADQLVTAISTCTRQGVLQFGAEIVRRTVVGPRG